MSDVSFIVPIERDEDGEMLFTLPDELMERMQWKVGDVLEWTDNGDETWSLKKLA